MQDASYHGDTVTLSAIVQEAPVGQPGLHLAVLVAHARVATAVHSSDNRRMQHRGHWDQSGSAPRMRLGLGLQGPYSAVVARMVAGSVSSYLHIGHSVLQIHHSFRHFWHAGIGQ